MHIYRTHAPVDPFQVGVQVIFILQSTASPAVLSICKITGEYVPIPVLDIRMFTQT